MWAYKPKETKMSQPSDPVKNPSHYGGKNNPYEVIKVIWAWKLGFCLGNAVKYIARAGKKDPSKYVEDLEKAIDYLQKEIHQYSSNNKADDLDF